MNQTDYVLGHSKPEIERLIAQSALLHSTTLRLLHETGLKSGMRVLDIGCGAGDVSMLAAKIVGKTGTVVGIDRSIDAINYARSRELSAPLPVHFYEEALGAKLDIGQFDLVISRWVILFQEDPESFLKAARAYVKPGGVLAFQEPARMAGIFDADMLDDALPLWKKIMSLIYLAVVSASKNLRPYDVSYSMLRHFKAIGLGQPNMFAEVLAGGGADCPFYSWAAATMRSLLPQLEKIGAASAEEVDLDTLEFRLRREAVTSGELVTFIPQFCGWLRID
jgi:ubiquinone/menaquinone biosynthesis C-methylase UbiE